jgi:hypothetical protein
MPGLPAWDGMRARIDRAARLLGRHYLPLATHYSPLTTHHSLTTHYSLLTTHYSLLTYSRLAPYYYRHLLSLLQERHVQPLQSADLPGEDWADDVRRGMPHIPHRPQTLNQQTGPQARLLFTRASLALGSAAPASTALAAQSQRRPSLATRAPTSGRTLWAGRDSTTARPVPRRSGAPAVAVFRSCARAAARAT